MRIYISPSTQEKNDGVAGYGTEEYRMNLIADKVVKILQDNHFEVYRNKPEMSLYEVVADSNRLHPDLHFAIHSNAGGQGKARGCEVFHYEGSINGQKLAKAVYDEIVPLTPTEDRGVKSTNVLYELRHTTAIAALIEVAFHDNTEDAAFIINNIDPIAKAIATGIAKYAGVEIVKVEPNVNYVLELQQICNKLNIRDYENQRLSEDGEIGPRTRSAIKKLLDLIKYYG